MDNLNKSITNLLVERMHAIETSKDEILSALHILLNGNYLKYDIENTIINDTKIELTEENFNNILAKLNEKTDIRKQKGVYYTPTDVSNYIIYNSIINNVSTDNNKTHNEIDSEKIIKRIGKETIEDIVYKKTFIDPTCGTGEFLVNVLNIKLKLLSCIQKEITDNDVINICKTIYGNDIDDISIDISKIRLFFELAKLLSERDSFKKLSNIVNKQFFTEDFLKNTIKIKFDVVVGNPPYVETSQYEDKQMLKENYGNIYAHVIEKSLELLKDNGVLGFIIPLSYVSTARMSKIRNIVRDSTKKQFILSFADRPDCLFNGVHQKLNIIIAKKGKEKHQLYISNYKHWYKNEREKLLNGRDVLLSDYYNKLYIPKIGNKIELNIFNKIHATSQDNIYNIQSSKEKNISIYLNMRACFWIKVFINKKETGEYKELKIKEEYAYFIHCLLNSSLFWLYWTIVSDCWHITSKELQEFYVPKKIHNITTYEKLALDLENKLEETKEYIGSKQVDYEYKHKNCKNEIDLIDNELAKLYKITDEELKYIKEFAINYRKGEKP